MDFHFADRTDSSSSSAAAAAAAAVAIATAPETIKAVAIDLSY